MKILFDVSILGYSELRTQYRTGIFQVAVALLAALAKRTDSQIGVYTSSGNFWLCRRALSKANLRALPFVGNPITGHLSFALLVLRNLLHKAGVKRLARWTTPILKASHWLRGRSDLRTISDWDVYFSPMDAVPLWIHDNPGLIKASLIHDLIPFLVQGYEQEPEDPTRWFTTLMKSIRTTDLLFSVSAFTRQDFLKYFPNFPKERISIAPNAVDRMRFTPNESPRNPPFFLAVSTIEPRKRLDSILRSYALYHQAGGKAELVICGPDRKGHQGELLKDLSDSDLEGVRFTGYVTDDELPRLYSSCLAFISMSEYEGFGLPILEALSCGAPVICSDRTSHPEVAGGAGVYVQPDDFAGIALAMKRMDDPVSRAELSKRALDQAARFSWDHTAGEILGKLEAELQ